MRVKNLTTNLELCEEGKYRAYRAKTPRGLSAIPVKALTNSTIYRVETGGPVTYSYVPRGSHAQVQVQAVVVWNDDDSSASITKCAVQYELGDRSDPVPPELVEKAKADARALIQLVATHRLSAEEDRRRLRTAQRNRDIKEATEEVAAAFAKLEAAVQVLHVRRGRVVGRQGFVLEKVEPLDPAGLVARVLELQYLETPLEVPREVLVPAVPDELATYEAFLRERRGSRVAVRVPLRGRRRALIEVAAANATEQLARHKMRRASDLSTRAQALEEIRDYLALRDAPLRIECYDMSHLQGTDYVGSMVVMEDGLPKRSDYRRFTVTAVQGNDDYGAMHEVLTRRLKRLDETSPSPRDRAPSSDGPPADSSGRGRPTRFAYPPQLLLIDGGKGQLGVGVQVLEELGLTGRVELASLAKQFEEVYRPGRDEPIRIPRDSSAIYLLQQIRDEAHRFAITYHRELRAKRAKRGALDDVAGLGPTRRARLVAELGGLRPVRAASLDDLRSLSWLPDAVADAVWVRLHPGSPVATNGAAAPTGPAAPRSPLATNGTVGT